ncbi:MAG TPA: hypothetical protein VNT30_04020 [Stellaceae bacterium]|nr:hypothetical protein [Stellaceae bacterium]
MALRIETFSAVKGGNSFFKAIAHPHVAPLAAALVARLSQAGPIAVYDPHGFAEGFAELHDLSAVEIAGCFVQAAAAIGRRLLGRTAQPVTDLRASRVGTVLIASFEGDRAVAPIRHLLPEGAEIVTFDAIRLPDDRLTNPRNYLDTLNFATNVALFRDHAGQHTRLVTANYWAGYGAGAVTLALTLFDREGRMLADWRQEVAAGIGSIVLDSRQIRHRFDLPEFAGQLFVHVIGAVAHDVVKYALDTIDDAGESLSCTHDANAWPADFYAGLPAPRPDETVTLWIQNSHPCPIPAGTIGLTLMGDDQLRSWNRPIAPFATVPIDIAELLPDARWPQQLEVHAGKHFVRPRYEIAARGRLRIAHANVERVDLATDPKLAELEPLWGKGFVLPAPILPLGRWTSVALPTPMATTQTVLPIAAIAYDRMGREVARHAFGRLGRRDSVAVQLDEMLRRAGGAEIEYGHAELLYDFAAGNEADGWLHGLFRYEDRATGHAADTSFGAHVFNTAMVYKDEPQSYAGRPPGLSTRLFLRLGTGGFDTLCHLIYPVSRAWHPHSSTDLILVAGDGAEIARRRVEIAGSGSYFWRYHAVFDPAERDLAGDAAYVIIRDVTCRLFGYHGLITDTGRFSLDHMFGF